MQLIFLGAPGSGKGTQAKELSKLYGYVQISTGDLLRNEVKKKSSLGIKVEKIMSSGQLVNDDIVFDLLKSNCNLESNNYIFDGFPRNIGQAKVLSDKILKNSKYIAIYFDISKELILERLIERRVCSSCGFIYNLKTQPPKVDGFCDKCMTSSLVHRADDQFDTIRERFEIFQKLNEPLKEFYMEQGVLKTVDATQSGENVLKQLRALI